MSRASDLENERNNYKEWYEQAREREDALYKEQYVLRDKLDTARAKNRGLTEQRDRARAGRDLYKEVLDGITAIDPSIDRFRDEDGLWKIGEIRRAADWIRGHDAVHSFDQHDDEAVAPVVFLFGGGDAA